MLTSASRSKQNAYPEFLVSISGREYFCIYFDSVIRECYISLWSERSETFLPDLKAREILTFMLGGTEGALSSGVGFELAEMGKIRLAFFAAGCDGEEAKNVAETVAK